NNPPTTVIHSLSLHDALPICNAVGVHQEPRPLLTSNTRRRMTAGGYFPRSPPAKQKVGHWPTRDAVRKADPMDPHNIVKRSYPARVLQRSVRLARTSCGLPPPEPWLPNTSAETRLAVADNSPQNSERRRCQVTRSPPLPPHRDP